MSQLKVLFSAGWQLSSGHTLHGIYTNLIKNFEVRVAGRQNVRQFIPYLDWNLEPLFNQNVQRKCSTGELVSGNWIPELHKDTLKELIDEVIRWNPDLIVIDKEPIMIAIANHLKIPSWDISMLNLMWTPEWNQKYFHFYSDPLNNFKRDLSFYANPTKKFIYSNLFKARLNIGEDLEWIQPFSFAPNPVNDQKSVSALVTSGRPFLNKIFTASSIPVFSSLKTLPTSEVWFCSGENHLFSELLAHNAQTIHLVPNLKDKEALVNASLIYNARLGKSLGQLELMKFSAPEEVRKTLLEQYNSRLSTDLKIMNLTERIKYEFGI